jgi:DNA-binding transcriptional LysR family regulator
VTLATRVTTPGCGSEWVQTQQVDLAICLHLRSLPQAHYTPLAALRLACLTPAGHPLTAREALTPADLQDYPVITVEVSPAP